MNISKITSLVLFLFFLGLSAQAQTETRTPGDFTAIESSGSWNVYITIGSKDEVRLESKGFDLNKVITEVKDGKLEIKLEKGNHRNVNFDAYITVRELESIGSGGSGNMTLESNINSDKFNIGQSGSGNVKVKMLNVGSLNVGMSGSGNMYLEGGSADTANIGQSGSGDFDGLELMANSVKIGKSGSGNTSIGASENLTVGSSGSGNVYYKGNPENKKIASSGSSKVIKK
ncbi:head GIN domain-containing protein [Algoriphagus sp. D3-2-R+10]|uniref:head GIN domain-containing protein n=1 Tax=Algoriphagus aurantiacus TaxID=3103948 RepID=UPI002B375E90|nr:head GIN domain-containing protein [Algoriphagus sp. D3-2-R+10]MEB2775042.1 head GIN domain-containing protein [Algoriphagus sp. D3-2-R+10]